MRLSRLCVCGKIVTGKCVSCSAHETTSNDDYRPSSGERYGKYWDDLSRRYRATHPLCEQCEAEGRTTAAHDVHHKVKVRHDKTLVYDWDNLMSVCRSCHIRLDRNNS